jgi:hypothetical protein
MKNSPLSLDRTAFSVISLHRQDREEKDYWLTKTPHERLQAVETMTQVLYGYDPTSARLQRVFEVTKRA